MKRIRGIGFWTCILSVILWAQPVLIYAQSPPRLAEINESDRNAIRAVIKDQLAAFQRDDGAAAFSHAAPGIRAQFGTHENFMRMVKQGYQPVYRPQRVDFLDLVVARGELIQRVFVVGPDGTDVIALYLMRRQPDGRWKINGCVLVHPEGKKI